jgi:hypothetical protein
MTATAVLAIVGPMSTPGTPLLRSSNPAAQAFVEATADPPYLCGPAAKCDRGLLLLVSGERDNTVPRAISHPTTVTHWLMPRPDRTPRPARLSAGGADTIAPNFRPS